MKDHLIQVRDLEVGDQIDVAGVRYVVTQEPLIADFMVRELTLMIADDGAGRTGIKILAPATRYFTVYRQE